MASTVQTAVETLYGSSDFAVFFDDTLMNDLVIDFTTSGYVNGMASSATVNCIYSEALYKIKNYDKSGNLKKEMHGIDYMTNVRIFIKNTVNNLYHMVFDGNLTGKSLTKSNDGNVSLSFAAEDYMHYLDKTVVPIAVPASSAFSSSNRLKWKAQGINVDTIPKYENESARSLSDKNIREMIDESIKLSLAHNAFFADKEGVTHWDAVTDRLKVMGDVSDKLREKKIIDYIVTSDGTSVSSMYVMIGSIANSLMFEFFQDRDGIIRIKPPFWNEGVLKDHIIMPSFVSAYEETTDFTKMYTRVVTQGSIDPSLNASGEIKDYLLPVGCYVAGDEDQKGVWVSYTTEVDPYRGEDRVKKAIESLAGSPNVTTGSVFGTSGIQSGTGSKPLGSATESLRPLMTQVAAKWGMSPVINILMAMLQQESSGGTGISDNDVMQAKEGAYGSNIVTVEDSMNAGVQEFKDALTKANGDVAVALQTYNFGPRFIAYVKENGGVYTTALAYAFSKMMQEKFSDDFPNGYGDPLYVPHVMQYVAVGSPTNYMPTTGLVSGASSDPYAAAALGVMPSIGAALAYNYIQSAIFYNTIQQQTDFSSRQAFSLPNFNSSSSNGLLGRKNAFTTGNAAFNPLLWGMDSSIVDFLNNAQLQGAMLGVGMGGVLAGNNGVGVVASGVCAGSATVTENLANIGRSNLDSRQWSGIKAATGTYIDCRQYSTSHLLMVARQYFGIPYTLIGEGASPEKGYDCASYVASVYSHFGIRIGTRVSLIHDYSENGGLGGLNVKPVAFESLAAGDLLIWPSHSHVAMYAGNGKMYAAPFQGRVVEEQTMTKEKFNKIGIIAIRRPAIFSDSPGAGSYTNAGATSSIPAVPVELAPPTAYAPIIYPNGGVQSVLEQTMDLIAGKTSIEGVSSATGFMGRTKQTSTGETYMVHKDSLPTGSPYAASAVRASNNIDTQEKSLLWQSNSERKYGANILNIDQPLIRGYDKFENIMTKDGPAGSISDALRSYSIFMHGLTNGLIETATLTTTAPMPWLRCGMNCWVDPMGIDKIFYINGIRHMGSAKAGVRTELSLGYGRSRYQYLHETNQFGSLRNDWKDNVFVSKIYQGFSIDAFGDVLDSKGDFENLRESIEKKYEIAGKDSFAFSEPRSIDNTDIYRDLYGGYSADTSGRDGLDISVIDPAGEILVRTKDGSIITGTEALKRYEESKKTANSTGPSGSGESNKTDQPAESDNLDIARWADGTGFPADATYEDKKCLKYLAWLETMPSLRYGDTNDQVKRLQRIFYYLGISIMEVSEITGHFGTSTRKGVLTLQGTFNISKTGVLTAKEVEKLKSLLKNLLSSASKKAYDSAVNGSSPTSGSSTGQPVLKDLNTKDSPLTGPIYQKSSDLYDYSYNRGSRSTKVMLLGAYSLDFLKYSLEKNYNQGYVLIRNRRDNVRKTFQRAMEEIATRSAMMKFKSN